MVVRAALAVVLAVSVPPGAARAAPSASSAARSTTADGVNETTGAATASPRRRVGGERFNASRYRWSRCANAEPTRCVRPRPARALLLSLGALAGGAAAGVLFALGDRLAPGDPAVVLVGVGGLMGVGALTGMALGWVGGDDAAQPDRVRPSTAELAYGLSTGARLDERNAHTMALRFAPTWSFPNNAGRIRLVGHVGGLLATATHVDPRPQAAMAIAGQDGSAPVALRRRQTSIGIGSDWAVALPYPVLAPQRSAFLGPSEIRYKPDVQIRRELVDAGRPREHIVSRTMLTPLTVGMRWHLSPRQRLTVYLGPRFDLVAFSEPGQTKLRRGAVQLGPLYAEAWYDLDVPLTARPRRDGKARRVAANSQLTFGYTHSRFDGRGFNFGPVVGFLGPLHAQWHTRVRPVGAKLAVQGTAAAALGNGLTMTAAIGLVAPDVSQRPRRPPRRHR